METKLGRTDFKQAFELPILTMEELDTKIASYPPKPKKDRSQNKTLDQVMTELDNEFEVKTSVRHSLKLDKQNPKLS